MQKKQGGSIQQAARRYPVGVKKLRAMVKSGQLPSYTAGCSRKRVVLWADVEEWLKSTRVEPEAPRPAKARR
ncbi:MAG: helix-turn-helix domain-containing protein [Myxococcota bacterium]